MPFEGIGASVRRKEDVRFLSGRGNYTDDINRPGQLHAFIRRSDRPHATINGIDTAAAAKAPGVVAVFTGADMAADNVGGLPCGWQIHNKDGSPMAEPPHPVLAIGKVRHVGDPVAVVIAETKQAGEGRRRADRHRLQDLPAVGHRCAMRSRPARRWCTTTSPATSATTGISATRRWSTRPSPAPRKVVKLDLTNNRLIPNAMEPRAAIGDFDPTSGDYTLYTTSQNPHVIRLLMGAFVLHIPENKLRVVAPDVGGGFGSKIYHYAEEAIVTWAAGKLRRPVKWTAERTESFMSDAHGRDHVSTAEMALDADGNFLGLRIIDAGQHGRLSLHLRALRADLSVRDAARRRVQDAGDLLRGEGGVHQHRPGRRLSRRRPAGGDLPAGAPGRCRARTTPASTASRSAARTSSRPTPSRTRRRSRCNTTAATTRRRWTPALKTADWAGFEARRAAAAARGKLRGIGISTYLEACGIAPSAVVGSLGARAGLYEVANIRVHPTGSVTVFTGTHSHGQGHETTLAQLVVRPARRADRSGRGRARRHREDPVRHGHLRQPQPRGRRHRRWSRRWTRSSPRARRSPPI